jgi:FkbM family methyltransferase
MGSMADASAWASAQRGSVINAYQVRFTTIDAFLSATSLQPPTFMKIDVEGAELFVLRGGANLFSEGIVPSCSSRCSLRGNRPSATSPGSRFLG